MRTLTFKDLYRESGETDIAINPNQDKIFALEELRDSVTRTGINATMAEYIEQVACRSITDTIPLNTYTDVLSEVNKDYALECLNEILLDL